MVLVGIATLSAFAGLALAVWLVGGMLVRPAKRLVGSPPNDLMAETVQLRSQSGAVLVAWHLIVPDSRATVILLHPIRGDRRSMLSRARLLHKRGYSTLLVDLQAHGESSGQAITLGHLEKHDVKAAVQYVRANSPEQKIAVIGRSLGGASTLFAKVDIDVVVIESVYSSVTEAVHNRIAMRLGPFHRAVAPLLLVQLSPRLGISPGQLRPIDHIGQLQCPVLIAAGDQDQHTTIHETRRLFAAASDPKELVVFKGAAHEDLLGFDPPKYENGVIGFIDAHLNQPVAKPKRPLNAKY